MPFFFCSGPNRDTTLKHNLSSRSECMLGRLTGMTQCGYECWKFVLELSVECPEIVRLVRSLISKLRSKVLAQLPVLEVSLQRLH